MEDNPTGNVQVLVRVRPPNEREQGQGYSKAVGKDGSSVVIDSKHYPFDYVVDETENQVSPLVFIVPYIAEEAIFERVGKPITESCLQGYHGCLLAYGQTGAGKTFTMQGPTNDELHEMETNIPVHHAQRGLIPRVLNHVFERIQQDKEEKPEECINFSIKYVDPIFAPKIGYLSPNIGFTAFGPCGLRATPTNGFKLAP
eukprot:6936471-Pyramimonas_sp.AAC.1